MKLYFPHMIGLVVLDTFDGCNVIEIGVVLVLKILDIMS